MLQVAISVSTSSMIYKGFKFLFSCRFRTSENAKSFGETAYNLVEQNHRLPVQTLEKLEQVVTRIEKLEATLEKRPAAPRRRSLSPRESLSPNGKIRRSVHQSIPTIAEAARRAAQPQPQTQSQTNGEQRTPAQSNNELVAPSSIEVSLSIESDESDTKTK